jgi:RNA polymerase sigma-70 factor (ECF subfamily)
VSRTSKRDGERKDRFRAVWLAHFGQIWGYTLRRVSSPDDAADCIAETFSIAWNKFDDVPENAEVLYWLYGVAWRVIANYRRSKGRDVALVKRLAEDLERSLQYREVPTDAKALEAAGALAELRPEDQEILRLASWEGLDSSGIAQAIGCTPSTARVRLHRARSRLAKRLDGDDAVTTLASPTFTDTGITPSRDIAKESYE